MGQEDSNEAATPETGASALATSRRRVLASGAAAAGAVAAGTVALAACGSNDTAGPASSNGKTSGQSDKTQAPAASGTKLVALDKVPVGGAVSAKDAAGKPIIVARPDKDTAVAFSAICTHMGCTVAPAGKELRCPCHGSVFQATTGKNTAGPAPRPLDKVDVHVAAGEVVTGTA
jgi:cytochrome b6-f complex iron-sulfur subunit